MTAFVRTTEPASEPVTVSDVKAQLRLSGSDDDALLTALISVARMACEEYTRRALITQGWTLWLDAFPADDTQWWDGVQESPVTLTTKRHIHLPRPPLISVTSISVYDDDDTATLFDDANYFVDTASSPGRVALRNNAAWPVPVRPYHGIEIVYVAGYGDATAVPQALKQGMLAHIAFLYEQRGDTFNVGNSVAAIKALPDFITALYQPYRIQHLGLP